MLQCKNEAYRYLKALGAADAGALVANHEQLTPLQLAVKLGGRCTQAAVVLRPGEGDGQLVQPPEQRPISLKNPTMAAFILKLSEEVRWTFGSVRRSGEPANLLSPNLRPQPSLFVPRP